MTYTKRWKTPNISISVNASNKQDLMSKSKVDASSSFYQSPTSLSSTITEDTSTLPSINFRVARRKLFKNIPQDSWIGNIQWDYNSRLVNNSKNFYEAEEAIDLSLIHISEPTRPLYISYAVFCLKKKKILFQK